jgi:hypothetical protein
MTYKYDVILTLREFKDPGMIIKQYHAKDVEFPNPISSGDKLYIAGQGISETSKPVEIQHPLGDFPKMVRKACVIHVDVHTFEEKVDRIEDVIKKYNPQEI